MHLDTDTSEASAQADTMLDALNVRLFQSNGDMVLTNLEGMDSVFFITTGFDVAGWCEYNGILYIASLSTTHFEIGIYPSREGGVLTSVYKPVHNYVGSLDYNALIRTGTPIQDNLLFDFRLEISKVDFVLNRRLDMLPKENYDGSVSLFVVDGEQPNRIFNTGKDKEGNSLQRYINDADLDSLSIEQFNEIGKLPTIGFLSFENDGFLKSGQYFFYIRYSSADKSPTSFIAHSAAISVHKGSGLSVEGGYDENTSKSISLLLSNLDRSYPFFEIGFVRYAAGVSAGYVISNLFSTDANSKTVKINGLEPTISTVTDEFLALKPYEKSCKSQCQINNRWYGANWKSTNRHSQHLVDFAKLVEIQEQKAVVSLDRVSDYVNGSGSNSNAFIDAGSIANNLGYFSGETYLFLLHPVFNDGRVGLGYPMKGADNYYGDMRTPNIEGVFRFSSQTASLVLENGFIHGKYPKLVFPTSTQWITDNVSGWYISRANRKENLLYQGYGTDVYSGDVTEHVLSYQDPTFNSRTDSFSIITKQKDLYLPLIKPSSYYAARLGLNNQTKRGFAYGRINPFNYGPQHNRVINRGAIFSTDYIIANNLGSSMPAECFALSLFNTTVETQGRKTTNSSVTWYDGIRSENAQSADIAAYHEKTRIAISGTAPVQMDAYNVPAWSPINNNKFTSRVSEGAEASGAGGFYYMVNEVSAAKNDYIVSLPMATPAYIGLEHPGLNINGKIVNLYRSDPTAIAIRDWYDYKNESVFICSGFIASNPTVVIVKSGDCFTQRVFLKALHGDNNWSESLIQDIISRNGEGLNAGKDEEDGYGHILSYVGECKYNAAFRFEKSGNKFFPATGLTDIGVFSFAYGEPESPFYDASYSRTIEERVLRGYNPQVYYGIDRYPTRIMYSVVQLTLGIDDSYRVVLPAQQQDFDLKDGPINCIVDQRGSLVSFQDRAINRHTIQERVYAPSTDGSPVLLGTSNILSEMSIKLSTYGCQHQWSVVVTPSGIYCVDANNRMILRVQEGVEAISVTKKVNTLVSRIMDVQHGSTMSDIVHHVGDMTLMGVGIHSVYDEKHKEVLFTFLSQNANETICFSEMTEAFISRYRATPRIYMKINRDLYSPFGQEVFSHDTNSVDFNKFYHILSHSMVRVVVGKDTYYPKRFESHVITSNNVNFDRFDWETQHQKTDLTISSSPFWYMPRFKKNQWYLPIPRAKTTEGDLSIYAPESPMTGLYMVLKVKYSEPKRMWLKEIITKFTKSNS